MWDVRPARDSDLPGIRALWAANPMDGRARYFYDAPPLAKPGYRLYLIELDGEPVGTFSLCPAWLGSRKALYVSDAVLERSARGRRLVVLACSRVLDEILAPEVQFLSALFAEANRNGPSLLVSRVVRVLYQAPLEIFHLPALRAREPEPSDDREQICDLVNAFYGRHAFFHPIAPGDLDRGDGFRVLVRRKRGRIVACTGVWNQQGIRRLMLVRPGAAIRAARWCVARLNPRLGAAAADGTRELVLHVLTEPAFAPGHEAAFHRLLDTVGAGRDAHAFQLAAHPASPLAALVRRRLAFVSRARLCIFQYGPQRAALPREPRVVGRPAAEDRAGDHPRRPLRGLHGAPAGMAPPGDGAIGDRRPLPRGGAAGAAA